MTHLLVHYPSGSYTVEGEFVSVTFTAVDYPWAVVTLLEGNQLTAVDSVACIYDGLNQIYGPSDLPLDRHDPDIANWLADHPYWDSRVCQALHLDPVTQAESPCEDPPAGSFGRHLCNDVHCSGWTFLCSGCLADCGFEPGWAQTMPYESEDIVRSNAEDSCVVQDPEPWFACIRAMEDGMPAYAALDLVEAADAAFLKAHPGQLEFVRPIVPGCDVVSERQVQILKERAERDAPGEAAHLCIMVRSVDNGMFSQPVLMVGFPDPKSTRARQHHPSRRHRKGDHQP